MTALQKDIFYVLLQGGSISGNIKYGYRLKDRLGNPLSKFTYRTFHILKPALRTSGHSFILNKKYVRSLSKRYWLKKAYLKTMAIKKPQQTAAA